MTKDKHEMTLKNPNTGFANQPVPEVPRVVNHPYPNENPGVPETLKDGKGLKKSEEILVELTKGIESKEQLMHNFRVDDERAFQFLTAVNALRDGNTPAIRADIILLDLTKDILTLEEFESKFNLKDKVAQDYFQHVVALRGEK